MNLQSNLDTVKPEIPLSIEEKWQRIVNLTAKIIDVPAALIMKKDGESIEVFTTSHSDKNPYQPDDKCSLDGLYCEWVIKNQKHLIVPDARKDKKWDHNPDINLNMISYLGFPINWPDGTPFGTICVFDSKENFYTELYKDFLLQYRDSIDTDLELIYKSHILEREIAEHKKAKKKLSEKIQELEVINKKMINRELRIVEIKQEVNELCREVGINIRYEFF